MPIDSRTQEQIAAAQKRYRTEADKIRNNRDWTPQAKQRKLAKLYVAARDRVSELRKAADQSYQQRRAYLEADAFGAHGVKDPSAAISLRDAMDRVDSIKTPGDAERLLMRASRSGDEYLMRAIAGKAFDQLGDTDLGNHWSRLLDMYASAQDQRRADQIAELRTLRQAASKENRFRDALSSSISLPTELQGAGNVDHLAAQDDDGRPAA